MCSSAYTSDVDSLGELPKTEVRDFRAVSCSKGTSAAAPRPQRVGSFSGTKTTRGQWGGAPRGLLQISNDLEVLWLTGWLVGSVVAA